MAEAKLKMITGPEPTVVMGREAIPASILDRLWTLSYIRNNAIKTTVLLAPTNVTTGDAVEAAKRYCKKRGVIFSWMEPTITEIDW